MFIMFRGSLPSSPDCRRKLCSGKRGYRLLYGFLEYLAGNTILYVISKIELIMPVRMEYLSPSTPDKEADQAARSSSMYAIS